MALGGGRFNPAVGAYAGMGVPQAESGIGTITSLANAQRSMLESQQLSRELQAKESFGELSSLFPGDPQGAINAALASPMGPYIPQVLQGYAETHLALTRAGAVTQDRYQNIMQQYHKDYANAYNNPSQATFDAMNQNAMDAAADDPALAARVRSQIGSFQHSVLDGLNLNNPQDVAEARRRMLSMYAVAGDAGVLDALSPRPGVYDLRGGIGAVAAPGVTGLTATGGLGPVPGAYAGYGVAPMVREGPGGTFQVYGGQPSPGYSPYTGGTISQGGYGAPNALAPPGPVTPGSPLVSPLTPQTGAPAGAPAAPAAAPTPPGAGIVGPGQTGPVMGGGMGLQDQANKDYQEVNNAVTDMQPVMTTLNQAAQFLQGVRMGPQSPLRMEVARIGQMLGLIDEKTADGIMGGDAQAFAKAQAATAVLNRNVMSTLRTDIPSGSRLNLNEWQAYQQNHPNLGQDPNTVMMLFNFWNRQYGILTDKQSQMYDWNAGAMGGESSNNPNHRPLTEFQPYWTGYSHQKGYTGQEIRPGDWLGTTPPPARMRINPDGTIGPPGG
jgi:hypothetical protein